MLKEIALGALVSLSPLEKKALDNFQTRLGEEQINYTDTTKYVYTKKDSIQLVAIESLTPTEKRALDNFQKRLEREGYDISQYLEDPRFGIRRFEKGKKQTDYTNINESWYLNPDSIKTCIPFMEDNLYWLKKVQGEHGISPEHMASLLQLETRCGKYTGVYPSIVAFASVYIDRPDRRTEYLGYAKDFFNLFTDTTDNILLPRDIFNIEMSYAGAYGISQGIPPMIIKHGPKADGDGDGVVNLMKTADAIKFAALLLDEEFEYRENPTRAIRRYNGGHEFYGRAIIMHADSLRKIWEMKKREPINKISNYPNTPHILKPIETKNLHYMKRDIPQLPQKQVFLKRIFTNNKSRKKTSNN